MLEYVPYKVSKRKWCLIGVAFVHDIWPLLLDERCKSVVEAAERWADGLTTTKELNRAEAELRTSYYYRSDCSAAVSAAIAAARPSKGGTDRAASLVRLAVQESGADVESKEKEQCSLIRDILGIPFRPVPFQTAWQTCTVAGLAQAIYADRAFERLPILADALEDAGCDNADILNHCRQGGEHVRGCWVVDLILGKK
jgi:hypothetical protein